jgi:hypothetical protein
MHHVTRLALHVIKGTDLLEPRGQLTRAQVPDTQLCVTVRNAYGRKTFQTRSRMVHKESAPEWGLSCVMDLVHDQPMEAKVHIEVRRPSALPMGAPKVLCAYSGSIHEVLHASRGTDVSARSSCLVCVRVALVVTPVPATAVLLVQMPYGIGCTAASVISHPGVSTSRVCVHDWLWGV